MKRTSALAFALLVFGTGACGTRTDERSAGLVKVGERRRQASEQLRTLGYLSSAAASAPVASPSPAVPQPGLAPLDALWMQQKLIREAHLALEVDDVDVALGRIERVARDGRGFVAGSEVRRGTEGRRSGSITLKVPSDSFDATLAGLREAGRVRHESTSTQDVTKAYADLETRLAVKRQTKERLEALLVRRTGTLSDLLQVERELERVVTEIERMLGEKRYFDQRVALSTITIALHEPGTAIRPGVFEPVVDASREAIGVLAVSIAAFIYAAVAAVPWILIAALVWFLIRRLRRRRAARSEASEAP